jgi:hypothetical protein
VPTLLTGVAGGGAGGADVCAYAREVTPSTSASRIRDSEFATVTVRSLKGTGGCAPAS